VRGTNVARVNYLRAFDVECLQFVWRQYDELASFEFVAFYDLLFLHLFAGAGVVRPQSDPCGRTGFARTDLRLHQGQAGALICQLGTVNLAASRLAVAHRDE
jgi:hypothetical protein